MSIADAYDLIVFDLDGTLVDSLDDIATSVHHAHAAVGLPPVGLDRVRAWVGHGAGRLIERTAGDGASPETVEAALGAFLAHHGEHCTERTAPYPGVRRAIAVLNERGKPLAVLTNKPVAMTRKVLEAAGLLRCFREVVGGDSLVGARPVPRKPDPEGLLGLVRRLASTPPRTLLIGDTAVDVRTARNAGCASAGVTYGFRPEEFGELPPDHVIGSLEDLIREPRRRDGS